MNIYYDGMLVALCITLALAHWRIDKLTAIVKRVLERELEALQKKSNKTLDSDDELR